jgi:general secretion pathway protein L
MQLLPAHLRRSAGRFCGWWLGEMAGLVPAPLRRLCSERGDLLLLDDSGPEPIVGRLRDGSLHEVRGPIAPRGRLLVRLPAHQVLRQRVELPLAAAENLREVLRFEMARLTPFTAQQVCFGARILSRDGAARRLEVDLAVARRGAVDRLQERAAALGLRAQGACVLGAEGGVLILESDEQAAPAERAAGGPLRLLAIVAAGLALALVYLPLAERQSRSEALAALVAEARAEAEATQQLRAAIDRVLEETRFAFQRRRQAPTVLAVVNELTLRLPDDTWLFELSLRDHEVQISGYSPAASSLIGLIESSPLFENARFRSPVTQDTRIGAEQFHLSADIARDGEPAT